jgi:hypothetical protein
VVVSPRRLVRGVCAAFVLAFFFWLWTKGVLTPGSLGWLRVVPLFLLGLLGYELLAHFGEAALTGGPDGKSAPPATVEPGL